MPDAAVGFGGVDFHQLLVGHLAGTPAFSLLLAVGQNLGAAGGSLLRGGGGGIGVDGQVVIGLPGNGFPYAGTQVIRGGGYFYHKIAAVQGFGGFSGDGCGHIVLVEIGIAEVGAVGRRTALRRKINFRGHGVSFRGVRWRGAGKSPLTNTSLRPVFCIEKVKKQHFLMESLQMGVVFA